MQIKVQISGDRETIARLNKLGNKLLDFSSAMRIVGQTLGSYYASAGFTDQGRPFGEPWPALSPRYLKWKEKHNPGTPMLVRTGDMQRGFVSKTTANSVTIDNEAPYFKYHQSTEARNKIPRRATMGLNDGIKATVKQIMEMDIRAKIDGVQL